VVLLREINLFANTTPALRAAPPQLRRGIFCANLIFVQSPEKQKGDAHRWVRVPFCRRF
jgi:hypothetical protein